LLKLKQEYSFTKIFTHNSDGEYGHDDHILVNEAVTALFPEIEIFCPIDTTNPGDQGETISILNNLEIYSQVKAIYVKNKAWTWNNDYLPPAELSYSLYTRGVNDNR